MAVVGALIIFISSSLRLFLLWTFARFLHKVWWTPTRIQNMMSLQGIKGPSYRFPHGNTKVISDMRAQSMGKPMEIMHDVFPRIQPHVYSWTQIYGMNFLNWHGSQAQLFVTEPQLIKEILNNREGAYPKMDMEGYAKKLLGEALITNEGEKTAFGSSFLDGKHIFEMVAKLIALTVRNAYNVRLPGISTILKTHDEIEAEKLERGIKASILDLVKKREDRVKNGEVDNLGIDYLGQLVKIAQDPDKNKNISLEQMVDEIKTLYGAGHLTTTNLLAWTVFLLAIHTDWQEKARKEVLQFFGPKSPTSDGIARLKSMNMIINESLRLYPPAHTVTRKVEREVKLGNLNLPANINIFISMLAVHHNPQIWGNDVHHFKPERFAEGVNKATKNNAAAFVPFGMGPRTCVGLNFTINEAKIALSMILQRYNWFCVHNHQIMDLVGSLVIILASSLCLYPLLVLIRFLHKVWWIPIRIQHVVRSQGIKGPSYKFLHGNTKEISNMTRESMASPMDDLSHDIFPRILPHVHSWINIYVNILLLLLNIIFHLIGKTFLNWYGPQAQLVVTEPELIKEILNNRNDAYPKIDLEGYAKKLLGDGLSSTKGEKWVKLRKLANHVFHAESLKSMLPAMISSTEVMLERWRAYEGKEIEVFEEFRLLTSEVISKTAFGSSYLEGKSIFEMLMKLTIIVSRNAQKIRFPGISQFVRSDDDIESEKLEQGIRDCVVNIIKRRQQVKGGGNGSLDSDFLGKLIEANHEIDKNKWISEEDMVDECKTLYFAGHETTTSLLGWTILLLATHKDWQEKARNEVIKLFGQTSINSDGIARLKVINMIIEESLRLYPPVPFIKRKVEKEVKLGKLMLPPHMELYISALALHHDPQIWGEDVHLFRPERFAGGVAAATKDTAVAFLPFGFGPRTCVGLSFAIVEAKIALSMILQSYTFTLSPTYVHSPVQLFMVRPQRGVQVILHSLE
ncbi:hypothetical protein RJ639_027099 [Escallonia herrerae]|uniref:Cytochrome P450 n=1 Tax=Escallonia herrerae TaxID=1293975 RepID=A0AA88X4J3_9ASTE|nr:hypothetical protein RJ639_027099 [Escallonia herrerae]